MKWNKNILSFEENEKASKYFTISDWEFLTNFNKVGKEFFSDTDFVLGGKVPIFILDIERELNEYSYTDIFEYYHKKINDEMYIFIYDDVKEIFNKKVLNSTEHLTLGKWIDKINSTSSFNKKVLDIDPYFFNQLLKIYKENNDDNIERLYFLRNFHSLLLLSDKIEVRDELTVSIVNNEAENERQIIIVPDKKISNSFFYIMDWICKEKDEAVIEFRYEVAKIYISTFNSLDDFNYEEWGNERLFQDLDSLLTVVLSKKAKAYYDYENIKNEQYIKLIDHRKNLSSQMNRYLLNMFLILPVALYGIFLTVVQETQNFSFINADYNTIYIIFIIGAIFLLLALFNEINIVNNGVREIILSINRVYKILIPDKDLSDKKLLYREFWFQITFISIFILILIIILAISNKWDEMLISKICLFSFS